PRIKALPEIWRRTAAHGTELIDLMPHQRPEEVRAAFARFRKAGLVESDALRTTERGAQVRQQIENDTDRLFFTPWPTEVGARADWVAGTLARLNAALA